MSSFFIPSSHLSQVKGFDRILVLDTETNGLPIDAQLPGMFLDNWPRLVQVAWCVYSKGRVEQQNSITIKPDGFTISEESTRIHGITQKQAFAVGVDVNVVLRQICALLANIDYVVCYNFQFDSNVLLAESIRSINATLDLNSKPHLCLMKACSSLLLHDLEQGNFSNVGLYNGKQNTAYKQNEVRQDIRAPYMKLCVLWDVLARNCSCSHTNYDCAGEFFHTAAYDCSVTLICFLCMYKHGLLCLTDLHKGQYCACTSPLGLKHTISS
jgi:DNA polymerase III epsilon subunit-like protein